MASLRLLGWGLLASAFLAAAMEIAAQSLTHDWGAMAASDVLLILAPDRFDAVRDSVDEFLHPLVWDYVVLPLLMLPGWVLFGVPGAALVWIFRPAEDRDETGTDTLPQASYEEIVAAAREADEDDIGIPSKYRDLDEYDPARHSDDEAIYPALDPVYLEQADMVPPARQIPSGDGSGGTAGNGDPGRSSSGPPGSGISRPF